MIIPVLTKNEINTYFKYLPDLEFIQKKLLPCFLLKDLNDTKELDISVEQPIIANLIKIVPELVKYISNNSIKKLFIYNKITFYKAIHLLNNFLNCFSIAIKKQKKNYKKTTKIFYSIVKFSDLAINEIKLPNTLIISTSSIKLDKKKIVIQF